MVAVRILQGVSGDDFSWTPGEVVDMSAEDASKWADGYRAELVRGEEAETPERSRPAPERAEEPEASQAEAKPETTAVTSRATRTRGPKSK